MVELVELNGAGIGDRVGSFRALSTETVYLGRGEWILGELIAPVLQSSKSYDRVTSFFNLESFLAVAFGIESLWRRGGRMRLIIGLHAVSPELLAARFDEERWPDLVLAELRSRLLEQVSTLRDEFSEDQLRALAWMLREGLLTVKVGFPVDANRRPTATGIFHPKKYLFTDSEGERIAAVGSPNETVPGMGANVEELTVIRSWVPGQSAIVSRHFEIFESLWAGGVEGTLVKDVDRTLGDEILERLGIGPRAQGPSPALAGTLAERVLNRAIDSPAFGLVSMGRAGFYPHQELAYLDALSRWPVRVLLADEVGLGKTLEAGAILSYLLKFGGARRVLILAPRSLMHQWQEELWIRFRIRAWRYESEERTFFDSEGSARSIGLGDSPVGGAAPDVAIVSAQLVRGRGSHDDFFRPGDRRPDVLIVDEAHHARVRPQPSGEDYHTRLWQVLEAVAPTVPHLVLLTATPMQLDWSEFHATLRLLGLPTAWQSQATYEESLQILARGNRAPGLDDVQGALKSMSSSVRDLQIPENVLRGGVGAESLEFLNLRGTPSTEELIAARKHWDLVYPLFIRLHPGHLLTIRRTRPTLTGLGYFFPRRRLEAPRIEVSGDVRSFYQSVQSYLLRSYGTVEQAVFPNAPGGRGFARSTYYQRMASSLQAAKLSLERRASFLDEIERACAAGGSAGGAANTGPRDDDEEPDDILSLLLSMRPADREAPRALAAVERGDISALLSILGRLGGGVIGSDPKLAKMCELIRHRSPDEKILVFSRYTDTVFACIHAFRLSHGPGATPGFAVYTGDQRWADVGSGEQPTSKLGIQEMLAAGSIDVVFCSDAAAEGLNLQSARTVINVDVPWNPSKLEQRIGRVDRLGQLAREVAVYNLWYPNSVEAIMYGRLAQRHDLYELAIGEAAEVIATEIQDQVNLMLFGDTAGIGRGDPLEQLQAIREDLQIRAHQQIWSLEAGRQATSDQFRQSLLKAIGEIMRTDSRNVLTGDEHSLRIDVPGKGTYVLDHRAGSANCLTLQHPSVQAALSIPPRAARGASAAQSSQTADLMTLSCEERPILFIVRLSSIVYLIEPLMFPELLRSCALGNPFDIDGLPTLLIGHDGHPEAESTRTIIGATAGWLPDHTFLRSKGVAPEVAIPRFPRPPDANWSLEPLGQITVSRNRPSSAS